MIILWSHGSLGKTIQVIAFLSGMFDAERVQSVLIVLPVAVITNWDNEFEKWQVSLAKLLTNNHYHLIEHISDMALSLDHRAPGIRVYHYHSGTKKDRERTLMKVQKRGGVCLTSYGMLVNNASQLGETYDRRTFTWVGT